MKYIIDIPDNTHWIQWIMEGTKDHHPYMDWIDVKDLRFYTEHDRKAIEDEVWEFLEFLFTGMNAEERYKCFDNVFAHIIVSTMSYQEAKSKYEAWLEQKDEIKVGDEVENASHKKGIVLNHHISLSNGLEYVRVLYMDDDGNSFVSAWEKNNVGKTGRHFDEVAELLEKMRGEEE